MLVFQNSGPDPGFENEKIFLQLQQLTAINPLQLTFLKGETRLSDNHQKMIRKWARKTAKYNIPVYIHSYAILPTGIRNLTEEAARHEALRTAFNRGIIVKNLLRQGGIADKRLIMKARTVTRFRINPGFKDSITLTIRRN